MTADRVTELEFAAGVTLRLDDDVLARIADLVAERVTPASPAWMNAEQAADRIAAPVSRVYALAACKPPRIPVHRDGSRLLFRPEELDRWVREGGAKRP